MAGDDLSLPPLELHGDLLDPMRLTATMCFPRDEPKRRALLASYRANVLCEGAKGETMIIERSLLREVVEAPSVEELAGWTARCMSGGRLAGELLLYLLGMHVFAVPEPSRKKALFVMDQEKKGSPMTIQRHFDHFIPVVHLWGAYYLERHKHEDTGGLFFGGDPEEGGAKLQYFLSLAAGLRYFAETTIQRRNKNPLIVPGALYAIPEIYLGDKDEKVKVWFGEDVGETLRKHLKAYADRFLRNT